MSYKREMYIGSPKVVQTFIILFGYEEYNRLLSLEEEELGEF